MMYSACIVLVFLSACWRIAWDCIVQHSVIERRMSFICPYPLEYGAPTDNKLVWVFEPGNCVSRCPSITYTDDEWNSLADVVSDLFIASLVGSTFVFAYQVVFSKLKKIFFPRLMFLLGFAVIAVILVGFLNSNKDKNLVCEENFAFITKGSSCVFQAVATIFFMIWIEIWSFFMALENFIYIYSIDRKQTALGKHNGTYFIIAVLVCTLFSVIPLGAGNLGFDYEANIPICLFIISDTKSYLWATLVFPFGLFAALCLILTVLSIYKIQTLFVPHSKYNAESDRDRNSISMKLSSHQSRQSSYDANQSLGDDIAYHSDQSADKEDQHDEPDFSFDFSSAPPNAPFCTRIMKQIQQTWKYNGRQMIFFTTYGLTTFAVLPLIIYLYGVKFNHYVDGTEDFAKCLIEASVEYMTLNPTTADQASVDAFAKSTCGSHPSVRPSLALVISCVAWFAAYGIIPVIIYGFISDASQQAMVAVSNKIASCCKPKERIDSTEFVMSSNKKEGRNESELQ